MATLPKPGKKTKRSYTDRVLKLLWGRAAGRCAMPECRIDLIAEATDYDPVVVIGEIAHVAAAGQGGPRAAPGMSAALLNDYDNLLLLCQNCHARADGQTGFNTVERLKYIKRAHESWVRASLPERGRSRAGWMGELEEALAAFESRPVRYEPADIARAGVFVSVDADGLRDQGRTVAPSTTTMAPLDLIRIESDGRETLGCK